MIFIQSPDLAIIIFTRSAMSLLFLVEDIDDTFFVLIPI
ncbi:hypothetical protein VCRA2128O98_30038 [Vibrio crassostreae]|nr:hypothetical protein VCRA2126O84_30045 [Vibrio crassostreae]CAK3900848.1 hypothetical protein VCRA2128O98_30038 [Vibrio crassostreae]